MSSEETAISVRGLSKAYNIVHKGQPPSSSRGSGLHARLKTFFPSLERETYWALKDVSFDIRCGDVVGIIGRNGAGKSTLLKILSRITEPTTGRIDVYGRIGSLLEVGTGFHPELTGRENIYLNGAILGMRKSEITRQFDEIVEFSGIEKFLDTPVKRYSSGMYIRLAFAVAAHLNPEILIVDEVLAVGDAEFQKKCLGKMKDVAVGGRTVLFVSHNMATIKALCTAGIVLHHGRLIELSDTDVAISRYMSLSGGNKRSVRDGWVDHSLRENLYTPNKKYIDAIRVVDGNGFQTTEVPMGSSMAIQIRMSEAFNLSNTQVGVIIRSVYGNWLANINTGMCPPSASGSISSTDIVELFVPRVPFVPGTYLIDVSLANKISGRIDFVEEATSIEVFEANIYGTGYQPSSNDGVIFLDASFRVRHDHHVDACIQERSFEVAH